MLIFWILVAALFSSMISGMFGMAGGMLLLAILLGMDYPITVAIPSHGVVMLVSHLSIMLSLYNRVSFRYVAIFIAASLPALLLAPFLMSYIHRHTAQLIISLFLGYSIWAPKRWKIKNPLKKTWANMVLAGFLGGAASLTIGIANIFVAPLYLREEWDNKTMLATKSACMIYLQILKIAVFINLGFGFLENLPIIVPMCIMVIPGNILGLYFATKVNRRAYRFLYKFALTSAVILLWLDIVLDEYKTYNA